MGPYRTQSLIGGLVLATLATAPLAAQEAGWHYSALPGEGDRATLGCDRDATPAQYSCLAVRCEDDFSIGIYVHSSRHENLGRWEMTVDSENLIAITVSGPGPYGAKITGKSDWLLERLLQGSFVYLRHSADEQAPFRYISLSGSLYAINHALAWCAPRLPTGEQIPTTDVTPSNQNGEQS
jgi:hypothetical protein